MRFLSIILLLFSSCVEAPGEDITGTLQGTPGITLPISGKKVCGGGLGWRENYSSGSRSKSSYTPPEPKYATDATLLVDGESLKLMGQGTEGFQTYGKEWRWSKYKKNQEVPKKFWGWGRDSTLNALTDPKITHSYSFVTATEEYTDCGGKITIRAIRKGNTLELVDKNPTQGRNALTVIGIAFLAFFFLLFLPMVLLIVFVLRRSIRKQKEKEARLGK